MAELEEIKTILSTHVADVTFEEGTEWLTMNINSSQWKEVSLLIRKNDQLQFDFLFCLTGVDWKTHLSVVYHLRSTTLNHTIVVKAKIEDREHPMIASVADLWRTAEFHEREAYDLFGIRFTGHPDLRRLFLTDDWQGWPLRKDYDDPVNMIKL